MQIPWEPLSRWVPSLLHHELASSRYFLAKSGRIQISSQETRAQRDNARACITKMHSLLVEAGAKAVPGQTSDVQAKRVKSLYVLKLVCGVGALSEPFLVKGPRTKDA